MSLRNPAGARVTNKSWLNDAARGVITSALSQKLRLDVFRHTIRVSENVCHIGGLLTVPRVDELLELFYAARPRRRHQPTTANISITAVAGSETAAFTRAPFLLPCLADAGARHVVVGLNDRIVVAVGGEIRRRTERVLPLPTSQ